MNACLLTANARPGKRAAAITLVEVIGVVGVIAILAAVMIPVTIRILDRIASEREAAALKGLADALELSIMKTRSIPQKDGLFAFIATNAGIDLRSVTNNLRNRKRVIQRDMGSSWFNASLPYTQPATGSAGFPDRARFILMSSIGPELPAFADWTPEQFDELWTSRDSTVASASVFAGWSGDSYDVKIQRLNIAPLFVKVMLSTYTPGTNDCGRYGVDGKAPVYEAPGGLGVSAYYIRGTELNLRTDPNLSVPPSHTQVLQEDSSWVFEKNVWQSSIIGPIASPGIGDLTGIVKAFLNAYPNPNSYWYTNYDGLHRTQQVLVVSTMMDFMSNYTFWSTNAPPFSAAMKTALDLDGKQSAMMDAIQGLYSVYGRWTNKPPPNMTAPPPL